MRESQDHSEEQVRRVRDVEPRVDETVLTAPLQEPAQIGLARTVPFQVELAKQWILRRRRMQLEGESPRTSQSPRCIARDHSREIQQRERVRVELAELTFEHEGLARLGLQDPQQELALVAVVTVDRPTGDAGPVRNRFDRGPLVPSFGEERERGLVQPVARFVGSAQVGRGPTAGHLPPASAAGVGSVRRIGRSTLHGFNNP